MFWVNGAFQRFPWEMKSILRTPWKDVNGTQGNYCPFHVPCYYVLLADVNFNSFASFWSIPHCLRISSGSHARALSKFHDSPRVHGFFPGHFLNPCFLLLPNGRYVPINSTSKVTSISCMIWKTPKLNWHIFSNPISRIQNYFWHFPVSVQIFQVFGLKPYLKPALADNPKDSAGDHYIMQEALTAFCGVTFCAPWRDGKIRHFSL